MTTWLATSANGDAVSESRAAASPLHTSGVAESDSSKRESSSVWKQEW